VIQLKPDRSNQIIIAALIFGLAISSFLYYNARVDISNLLKERDQFSSQLLNINNRYSNISSQLQILNESNIELSQKIKELENHSSELSNETPTIILNITAEGEVKNVILLIGDGMGIGQITVAEIENGEDSLAIDNLPYMSLISTHSLSSYVTDSAASATALATGYKTNNGVVSKSSDGLILSTIVEVAESRGLSTGVVTNTRITHATPACFLAHANSRDQESLIAEQVLNSGVDVVLGGGRSYFSSLSPSDKGYDVVETTEELLEVESSKVIGLFTASYMSYDNVRNPEIEPSLAQMTKKSIDLLSSDPEGFFLMVEGGRIDHASHANDFENTVSETLAFDLAVSEALGYASSRNDTLIIVTADHETGGLMITGGYQASDVIYYDWVCDDHVGSLVPIYAYGPRAEEIMNFSDNTDVGKFLISLLDK
jgi:alkaline phosphatase